MTRLQTKPQLTLQQIGRQPAAQFNLKESTVGAAEEPAYVSACHDPYFPVAAFHQAFRDGISTPATSAVRSNLCAHGRTGGPRRNFIRKLVHIAGKGLCWFFPRNWSNGRASITLSERVGFRLNRARPGGWTATTFTGIADAWRA